MGVKQAPNGECEDRIYVQGVLQGQATVVYPDSAKEIRNYNVSTNGRGDTSNPLPFTLYVRAGAVSMAVSVVRIPFQSQMKRFSCHLCLGSWFWNISLFPPSHLSHAL